MNSFIRLLTVCITFSMTCFSQAFAERYALLIGVSEYPDPDNNLDGPVKDVANFKAYLEKEHGFSLSEITTLLNRDATTSGVHREMQKIVKQAVAGDVVVIYFSGHGTQEPDLDGDERDGKDEVICTYDFRSNVRKTQYRDDDFRRALNQLKTDRALVVLDCCHSGTGTRSVNKLDPGKIKMIPSPFYVNNSEDKELKMRSIIRTEAGMRHLLIAGCKDNEVAYEGEAAGGGYLTNALIIHGAGKGLDEPLETLAQEVKKQTDYWCSGKKLQGVSFEGAKTGTLRSLLKKEGEKIEVTTPPELKIAANQEQEVKLNIKTDKEIYRNGERVLITLKTDRDCHARVYYTDHQGKSFLIFPNKYHQNDHLEQGGVVVLEGNKFPFAFWAKFPDGYDGKEVGEVLTAVASIKPFSDKIGNWGESFILELQEKSRGNLITRGIQVQSRPGIAVTPYLIQK